MLSAHRNAKYTPVLTAGTAISLGYGLGRWRIVLALMALTMCVCFVMFFFLPENSAIRQPILDKPVNEFLLPNVPHHREVVMQQDIHIQQDRQRLEQKIRRGESLSGVALQLDQADESRVQDNGNRPRENLREIVNQQQVENMIQRVENIENSNRNGAGDNNGVSGNIEAKRNNHIDVNTGKTSDKKKGLRVLRRAIIDPRRQGIPRDEETRQRREKVKEVSNKYVCLNLLTLIRNSSNTG